MEKGKVAFKFAGVPIYESDLSKEAVARLNKELVNHIEVIMVEISEIGILTEKTLKEMLLVKLKEGNDLKVIESILSNTNLKEIDEESWKDLSKHENWGIRRIAAQSRFATEERLKEMLKYEVKAGRDLEVIEAILLNSHLKEVDEESWRGLSEHGSCEIRKIAAQSRFATEERLKEMLKYEVKAGRDLEVIEAILLNSHLKEIDEGSWKDLSKHESWRIREIAAQSRFATEERLEEMIKREVKVGKDLDVINAIISNLNFKNDEETSS